ncbi:hypothetical protein [Terrimonas ferruginea]|uniref:hypothetical protein n=1 Tax=Terrimonas ferruginea TaxID=249 RepID=UPI0004265627|nr:hypothetical protein [Terrimonas ferruginea]
MQSNNSFLTRLVFSLFLLSLTGLISCSKNQNDDEELKDAYFEFTLGGNTQRYNNCSIARVQSGGYYRYVVSAQQPGSTVGRNSVSIEINYMAPGNGSEIDPGQITSGSEIYVRFYHTDATGTMFNSSGTTPVPFLTVTDAGSKFLEVSNFSTRIANGSNTQTMTGSFYARAAQ